MLKKNWVKFWPVILITIVVFTFHSRLFFPELSIYVTPDFARSDVLHSNLPAKFELAKSLKSAEFPLWNYQIGQGFPLLAEGIVGTFYIPNLILFGLFPVQWSIPLMYVSTFLIAAIGMYALLRRFRLPKFASTIGALSYTFCASMMLHVQHFNFIQAASLLPIILFLSLELVEKPKIKKALLLLIFLSQLFFTGFVQIYVYTVIVLFFFIFLYSYLIDKKNFTRIIFIFVAITIGSLVISSAQVLPTIELHSKSARSEGLGATYILGNFPMSPKNLAKYLNPFLLGSAKNGTANSTDWTDKGVYWESTSYIGLLSLFFVLISTIFLFKNKGGMMIYRVIALLTLITALLSLGKYAPTHIFYSFPPLSLFRVPSRFILFTQFFLVILAAYGAKKVIEIVPRGFQFLVGLIFISLAVGDIFTHWYNYNPIGSFKSWTSPPETAKVIKGLDPHQPRILSLGNGENWNDVFVPSGWNNEVGKYFFFRNSLDQNLNLLFDINQLNVFETLPTRRYLILNAILNSNFDFEENRITVNQKAKNILDNNNVRFIISTKEIQNDQYNKIFEIENGGFFYKIFESKDNAGYGKMYFDYKTADTLKDITEFFNNSDLEKTAILEKDTKYKNLEQGSYNIRVKSIKNQSFEFEVETEKPGIFVVPVSYYPGWQAELNRARVEILAANLNSQAIELPIGKHNVTFSYKPVSFRLGLVISLVSYFIIISSILFRKREVKILETLLKKFSDRHYS